MRFCCFNRVLNIAVGTASFIRKIIAIHNVPISEVPWEGTHLQLMWRMADGDHGHLYLVGEHHVGHGGREELLSSADEFVDNHRETEYLRYQSVNFKLTTTEPL